LAKFRILKDTFSFAYIKEMGKVASFLGIY